MTMGEDGILRPNIIKPDILGKGEGSLIKPPGAGEGDDDGSNLATFDTEDEEEDEEDRVDAAESREALSAMLGLLGFPDLPATRTDLTQMAGRMVKLQNQLTEAIKDLQKSGADMAGAGSGEGAILGPPDPAVKTKIDALNDLQQQLKDAGLRLKDYAYQYFSDLSVKEQKVLPLSQAQTLRAYEEGLIGGDIAKRKLAELGMSEEDIGILIKGSNKEMAGKAEQAKREKGVDADTLLEAYESKALNANQVVLELKKKGFTEQDIRLVLKIIDNKKKEKEKEDAERKESKEPKNTTRRTTTTSGNGGSSSVNVNVNVDTAKLAREALERAKAR
jgi:hypothetical protein